MPVSLRYVIKRIFYLFLVVLGVITIVFIATRIIPAHPEFLWAGPHATEEQLQEARNELRLNDPIWVQYVYFIENMLTFNFGISWSSRHPISQDILSALPATLELAISGFIIGILIGLFLGIRAAVKYGSIIDKFVRSLSISGSAIPVFWLALIFQLILAIKLGILPVGYRIDPNAEILEGFQPITGFYTIDTLIEGKFDLFLDVLKRLLMPALVVSVYPLCLTARMTRSLALETLQEDYVRNMRSWGVKDNVIIRKYVIKAVIPPLIASLGLSFGYALVGSFLVEVIFAWNGLGMYVVHALANYDFPAVIISVMTVAIIYSSINTVVDILHAYLDPRIRL